jgi:hypothetical protein
MIETIVKHRFKVGDILYKLVGDKINTYRITTVKITQYQRDNGNFETYVEYQLNGANYLSESILVEKYYKDKKDILKMIADQL